MRAANLYWAVYVVIKNEKWEILFWRRKNSWFKDGFLQLIPAGHLEWEEKIIDCAIREAKEELDIDILPDDVKVINASHRVSPDRVNYDIYVEVSRYYWDIKLKEPDKCDWIVFVDIDNLPKDKFVMYDIEVLKIVEKWEFFSEIRSN